MSDEREIKLSVPDSFELPSLEGVAGLHVSDHGVKLLEGTYWDTPRMDLYRLGAGLRHRLTDGGQQTWTLKSDARRDGCAVVRRETDVPGDAVAPPEEVRALLPAGVDQASLRPVASIRTERHVVDLLDESGQRWAELADDRVAVLRERQVVETFREVEVEMVGADDPSRAAAVVATLEAAGARDAGGRGKHSRALEALGLLPMDAPRDAVD